MVKEVSLRLRNDIDWAGFLLAPASQAHRAAVTRVVLLSTAALTISLSALAADLPAGMESVAPVAHVPAFSWTGFYVGGELGWIRTDP